MLPKSEPRLVVVWDFDQTIVSVNTDTFVFERLAPDILDSYIHSGSRSPTTSWTSLMDAALELVARRGISADTVLETVSEAPLPVEIRDALALVRDAPHAVSAMLSDANTLYIDAVLTRWGLTDAFEAAIVTNPAHIVPRTDSLSSRVTVTPFHAGSGRPPHVCTACPANMCKGDLFLELAARYPEARFVYVGDGANDLCPSKRLGVDGTVLPRVGYTLARKLATTQVCAQVRPWTTPCQLRESIQTVLSETYKDFLKNIE
jgi:pyridoxal phosphate phosphatase PHOSPHO2